MGSWWPIYWRFFIIITFFETDYLNFPIINIYGALSIWCLNIMNIRSSEKLTHIGLPLFKTFIEISKWINWKLSFYTFPYFHIPRPILYNISNARINENNGFPDMAQMFKMVILTFTHILICFLSFYVSALTTGKVL